MNSCVERNRLSSQNLLKFRCCSHTQTLVSIGHDILTCSIRFIFDNTIEQTIFHELHQLNKDGFMEASLRLVGHNYLGVWSSAWAVSNEDTWIIAKQSKPAESIRRKFHPQSQESIRICEEHSVLECVVRPQLTH